MPPPEKRRSGPATRPAPTTTSPATATDPQSTPCSCCAGTGYVQWPPEDRPACPCALDRRDRRPAALRRRLAYLQSVMATHRADGAFDAEQASR
jgi:hypothetical protein